MKDGVEVRDDDSHIVVAPEEVFTVLLCVGFEPNVGRNLGWAFGDAGHLALSCVVRQRLKSKQIHGINIF
jgi:hypothetical protein